MNPLFDVRLTAFLVAFAIPLSAQAPRPRSSVDVPKLGPEVDRQAAATEIWTDHLKLRAYPSVPAVAPGHRVSLVLEIEPAPRIHVYAPGAKDYRVITLTIATQPFVRLLPMQYPASEIFFFEPLNERVPIYQGPFKLTQELILDGQPQAQAAFRGKQQLVVTGMLNYQACDDKVCFRPTSVPLSWTLALQPQAPQHPGRTLTPSKERGRVSFGPRGRLYGSR